MSWTKTSADAFCVHDDDKGKKEEKIGPRAVVKRDIPGCIF